MSADLLDFDDFYRSPQTTQSTSQPSTTPTSNDLFAISNISQSAVWGNTGNGSQCWTPAVANHNSDIWGDMRSSQSNGHIQQASATTAQDDVWGSFEEAVPEDQNPVASLVPKYEVPIVHSTTRSLHRGGRRSTVDMFSDNMADTSDAPRTRVHAHNTPPPALKPQPIRQNSSGGEILFDADDVEDDDDFGDFQTVTEEPVAPAHPPPSQSINNFFNTAIAQSKLSKRPTDLLSTSTTLDGAFLPYPQAPKSPSFQERNPFSELGLATKQIATVKNEDEPKSGSPVTAWPAYEEPKPHYSAYHDSPAPPRDSNPLDEGWADFSDKAAPPNTPKAKSNPEPEEITVKATTGIEVDSWAWDAADGITEVATPVDTTPPTNVPPPSVILSLFPTLFDLPQSALHKAVADQPFSLKNRIISDPTTIDFLRAYLLIATVSARIIAGRKLRWKRDLYLSQAMKIGPASAGGKSGMKLAGLDKAEIAREDREAADVVRVWKDQVGRLKSAVAVANTSMKEHSKHLKIPEIAEKMVVTTQKGAAIAPKQCLICGLKREERVKGVDGIVEDSFGEWWIDFWGHRACRNFWQEHEGKLQQR